MPEEQGERLSLQTLNRMPEAGFVAALGGLFEGSPWVARQACAQRPFRDAAQLFDAMREIVRQAPVTRQLALLRAHPELGAARTVVALSNASRSEQSGAGLDRGGTALREQFAALNRAYRDKFGFPFVVAVRGLGVAEILAGLEQRLPGDRAAEIETALGEACRIAEFRLRDLLS